MILNYCFTKAEKQFMDEMGFEYSESMLDEKANDLIESIADEIQSLNESDRNIAEDIITKITTHPEW